MNKSIGIFLLGGAFAAAIVLLLRPSPSAPAPVVPAKIETTSSVVSSSTLPPAESSSGADMPVVSLSTTQRPSTPAPGPATTTGPATTYSSSVATPTGTLTNNPKTLGELYRAFDAINAAAEQSSPESLATLVGFAATENSDVRGAALDALINRDDAAAAALLRKAAKQLDDSKAIIALLETADYIELPGATMSSIAARPPKPKTPRPNERASSATPTPSP